MTVSRPHICGVAGLDGSVEVVGHQGVGAAPAGGLCDRREMAEGIGQFPVVVVLGQAASAKPVPGADFHSVQVPRHARHDASRSPVRR